MVPLHPLSNIEIAKYFNYEPRFNGAFSENNLPRIKDGVYVINFKDNKIIGTHWVLLFIDRNKAVYFHSFGIKYIPPEVLNKIKVKPITHNMFRMQDNDSVMCGFY